MCDQTHLVMAIFIMQMCTDILFIYLFLIWFNLTFFLFLKPELGLGLPVVMSILKIILVLYIIRLKIKTITRNANIKNHFKSSGTHERLVWVSPNYWTVCAVPWLVTHSETHIGWRGAITNQKHKRRRHWFIYGCKKDNR